MDESADDGARRELYEETGLKDVPIHQFYTFTDPGRDPRGRVISIAYYAVVPLRAVRSVRGGDDAADAAWFSLDELPPLAFDHEEMLRKALIIHNS